MEEEFSKEEPGVMNSTKGSERGGRTGREGDEGEVEIFL